ncbi:Meiotically up-regulated [Hyphodiscus hymeniophilus]|uniref:Meiotically up-regulated n=1 Tax=Hyphodiscus hymeniophilus TaxID=353542 RepID=A0A9P6VH37_9HELO|nr:Meiotically up-regulated [Hyphodiscus hymeniophilus]
MILGQVSWLDCFVFLVFLAPQLIIQVGFFRTLVCGLQALPFLIIKLPLGFLYDRLLVRREYRNPFVQQASWFEDIVIRCVRYAFAYIPASIGRVFFSKAVSLPFMRFRMLRHGYLRCPIKWEEIKETGFTGLWVVEDNSQQPDIVIYYAHGGGFSMGSSYFYLEFLLAWLTLLKRVGYRNPAILALEYTLVPDQSYPVQLQQAIAGYKHALAITKDSSKICVSGDSAGGTLILSLLLHLANSSSELNGSSLAAAQSMVPAMAVLISPWTTLVSSKDRNTPSDYLDVTNLHHYAHQYARNKISIHDPLISPGKCKDVSWWRQASPSKGFFITYGAEEVFAPEIRDLVATLEKAGLKVEAQDQKDGIHAWPVAALFLSSTREERQKGLKSIVERIRERMDV